MGKLKNRKAAIANGHSIWMDWKKVMMLRRSRVSANTPPKSVSSQIGALVAKLSRPKMKGDAPKLSNSHGSATDCDHVPILDKKLATQKVPKRGLASRRNEAFNSSVVVIISASCGTKGRGIHQT